MRAPCNEFALNNSSKIRNENSCPQKRWPNQAIEKNIKTLIKMTKIAKTALNLKQFMLRQEVLKLYREIFRTIRLVPDKSNQRELRDWARHDFRLHSGQTDELGIRMMLQHGRRSLTELQTSLDLSGLSERKEASTTTKDNKKTNAEEIKN